MVGSKLANGTAAQSNRDDTVALRAPKAKLDSIAPVGRRRFKGSVGRVEWHAARRCIKRSAAAFAERSDSACSAGGSRSSASVAQLDGGGALSDARSVGLMLPAVHASCSAHARAHGRKALVERWVVPSVQSNWLSDSAGRRRHVEQERRAALTYGWQARDRLGPGRRPSKLAGPRVYGGPGPRAWASPCADVICAWVGACPADATAADEARTGRWGRQHDGLHPRRTK
mmetsp:Transcript_36738/g.108336  ORF Transcript_36738/g.108336 Transcript_36738/m.108336 type:complete len:229 (+) Transcript_36738:1126-1812(+)